MKPIILLAYLFFMIPQPDKTPEDFRWRNRLVILNFEGPTLRSLLDDSKMEMEERKLLFVEFNNGKLIQTSGKDKLDPDGFLKTLSKASTKSDWILIGLDGGVKASGTFEDFSVKKIFRLVDQMPMRKSEIDDKIF